MLFTRVLFGAVVLAATAAGAAFGQTGYTITGGMSNFDCTNRCDEPCDELEVDIQGVHPEDVIHTYHNFNYGSPSVTLSPDGTYTIVDYRNPQHLTAVNTIEHFGISLRSLSAANAIRIRWYRNGQPTTVNGQLPVTGGGTAPATQPVMPSISANVTSGSHGQGGVVLTVRNNDMTQPIWVKRRAQITAGIVSLEDLMPEHSVVTSALQIDASPVYLGPGQTLTLANDLIEVEETQSAVFAAQYYQNLAGSGPFTQNLPGPELGNVMTASVASPITACAHSIPTVISQPQSVEQDEGTRVDLHVQGHGDDLAPLDFQWMKEGVPITDGAGVSGATTSHLRIDHLTAAGEGFYSVRLTNVCATTVSKSALVFITGHNVAPPVRTIVCPAITAQPLPAVGCMGATRIFTVAVTGDAPLSYQWRFTPAAGGTPTPLADGTGITGSSTALLTVSGIGAGRAGSYECTVTNSCGSATSQAAALTVGCPNAADVAGLGGAGGCDALLTADDLIYYLSRFFADDATVADLVGLGGSAGADGAVTTDDLIAFLGAFFAGCP